MTCRLKKLVILAPTVSSAKTASLPPDYANFLKIIKVFVRSSDHMLVMMMIAVIRTNTFYHNMLYVYHNRPLIYKIGLQFIAG